MLTVPASFDEAARELTLEAANSVGLAPRLLEEPTAAFYDWMRGAGPEAPRAARLRGPRGARARVRRGRRDDGPLARSAWRGRTRRQGSRSRGSPSGVTCSSAATTWTSRWRRRAKRGSARSSTLRASRSSSPRAGARRRRCSRTTRRPKRRSRSPAPGSRLVGSTLAAHVVARGGSTCRARWVLAAAPSATREPPRARGALVAFGLPYERDVAITRHVAAFFARHAASTSPSALLLNGGVFRADRIASRLVESIDSWGGAPLRVLPSADPDLAVARGAVAYALARHGRGVRIGGGSSRGYYVEVASDEGARSAVCVVPRGALEGEVQIARSRPAAIVVGRAARFAVWASDEASGHAPGDVVALDEEMFTRLPPIVATFGARERAREAGVGRRRARRGAHRGRYARPRVRRTRAQGRRGATSLPARLRAPGGADGDHGAAPLRGSRGAQQSPPRRVVRGDRPRLRQGADGRERARDQGSRARARTTARRTRDVGHARRTRPVRRARAGRNARVAARPITSGCSGSSPASVCAPASAIRTTRRASRRSPTSPPSGSRSRSSARLATVLHRLAPHRGAG